MARIKTSFGTIQTQTQRNRDCFFKVGDRVVLLPESPYDNINEYEYWKEINVFNHKELCEFGTVINLEGPYIYVTGKNPPKGLQHHRTVVRFDDGRIETFNNLYYRLIGRIFK